MPMAMEHRLKAAKQPKRGPSSVHGEAVNQKELNLQTANVFHPNGRIIQVFLPKEEIPHDRTRHRLLRWDARYLSMDQRVHCVYLRQRSLGSLAPKKVLRR